MQRLAQTNRDHAGYMISSASALNQGTFYEILSLYTCIGAYNNESKWIRSCLCGEMKVKVMVIYLFCSHTVHCTLTHCQRTSAEKDTDHRDHCYDMWEQSVKNNNYIYLIPCITGIQMKSSINVPFKVSSLLKEKRTYLCNTLIGVFWKSFKSFKKKRKTVEKQIIFHVKTINGWPHITGYLKPLIFIC